MARIPINEVLWGNFRVLAHLGSGGTGHVFEAEQISMERSVAVKILLPELTDDPQFRHRFQREARAIGRLSHPNIVHVHEFIDDGAELAIVMQYVDGGPLNERLRRTPPSGTEGLRILRSVASAIDYAHARHLLHRDIKPHNVLLEQDGPGVWLADFGLLKQPGGTVLTRTGRQLMGTVPYMAPEILRGEDADQSTDRWAFAVTAWQVLTGGAYPFAASNETRASPREQPPAQLEPAGDCQAAIYEVFTRALSPARADRPSTAEQLVDELDQALGIDRDRAEAAPAFHVRSVAAESAFTSWDIDDAETRLAPAAEPAVAGPELPLPAEAAAAELLDAHPEPPDEEAAEPEQLEESTPAATLRRDRRPRGNVARRAPALAAGVLLLAGAGAAAALTLGGREQPSTPPTVPIDAGKATFNAPAGVEPATDPDAITRAAFGQLDVTDSAAIGTPADGVAIATVADGTTALTPASTARGRVVDVAGGRARRYTDGGVTTAIAQTPSTVVRIACTRASDTCDQAIESLRLAGEQLQADPIAAVQSQLRAALDEPRGSRSRLTLPTADLQRRENRASTIAAAYRQARDAAAAVGKERPRDRDLAALTAELDAAAAAYTEISQAAGNRSAPGDRRGRAALRSADAALKARRARFTSRGYDLSWPSTAPPRAATITPRETTGSSTNSSTSTSTSQPSSAAGETPASGNTSSSNPPAANNSPSSSGGGSTCDLGPC